MSQPASLTAQLASALPEPVRCPHCATVLRVQWRRCQSIKARKPQWSAYHPSDYGPRACPWQGKFWPTGDSEAAARELAKGEPKP